MRISYLILSIILVQFLYNVEGNPLQAEKKNNETTNDITEQLFEVEGLERNNKDEEDFVISLNNDTEENAKNESESTNVELVLNQTTTMKPILNETNIVYLNLNETTTTLPILNETTIVDLNLNETITVESVLNNTTTVLPVLNETSTIEPMLNETTIMEPMLNETTTMEPMLNETTTMEQIINNTTTVLPIFNETPTMEQFFNETTTFEPILNEIMKFEPIINETTTVLPVLKTLTVKPLTTNLSYYSNILSCDAAIKKLRSIIEELNVIKFPSITQKNISIYSESILENLESYSNIAKLSVSSDDFFNLESVRYMSQLIEFILNIDLDIRIPELIDMNEETALRFYQKLSLINEEISTSLENIKLESHLKSSKILSKESSDTIMKILQAINTVKNTSNIIENLPHLEISIKRTMITLVEKNIEELELLNRFIISDVEISKSLDDNLRNKIENILAELVNVEVFFFLPKDVFWTDIMATKFIRKLNNIDNRIFDVLIDIFNNKKTIESTLTIEISENIQKFSSFHASLQNTTGLEASTRDTMIILVEKTIEELKSLRLSNRDLMKLMVVLRSELQTDIRNVLSEFSSLTMRDIVWTDESVLEFTEILRDLNERMFSVLVQFRDYLNGFLSVTVNVSPEIIEQAEVLSDTMTFLIERNEMELDVDIIGKLRKLVIELNLLAPTAKNVETDGEKSVRISNLVHELSTARKLLIKKTNNEEMNVVKEIENLVIQLTKKTFVSRIDQMENKTSGMALNATVVPKMILSKNTTLEMALNETSLETTTLEMALNENLLETTTLEMALNETSLETTTLEMALNETLLETTTLEMALNETSLETTTLCMENCVNQNETESSTFNPIQFEIKNYTILSHNASFPNSYSLRIRVKGYKWNQKFSDVKSKESQSLLKEKILPLLYKSLNLVPSEINEVKLLKLFRGKRGSSTSLEIPTEEDDSTDDDENDLVYQIDLVEKKPKDITLSLNQTLPIFFVTYPLSIVSITENNFNHLLLNNTLESLVKQCLFKHFEQKLEQVEIETIMNSNWPVKNVAGYPILITLQLISYYQILNYDISQSLFECAINKQHCEMKVDNSKVGCFNIKKDIDSLLRIEDMWLKLSHNETRSKKLLGVGDLLEFNSAWVFGIVIISCILALFFIGCISAIFYTRKPYRRSGKVYDMETAIYKKSRANMYPSHKQPVIPKHKEVFY